jgi:hypothetical protein
VDPASESKTDVETSALGGHGALIRECEYRHSQVDTSF